VKGKVIAIILVILTFVVEFSLGGGFVFVITNFFLKMFHAAVRLSFVQSIAIYLVIWFLRVYFGND